LLALPAVAGAQPQTAPAGDRSRPFVLGVVEELQSAVLGETRTLNIYLPAGYAANDTARYPVIYLLDGSADEDFIHVVGVVQFNTFPWVNRMPPSIVVGIGNVNRKRDFTYPSTVRDDQVNYPETGHSDKFISFIETELQPYINNKYRTGPARMIIGQSLAGLLAVEILAKKPQLFTQYLIISPSLWWDDRSMLRNPFSRLKDLNAETAVYIGVGAEGPTPTAVPGTMEEDARKLADKLEGLKCSHLRLHYDFMPDDTHGTAMQPAVINGFRMLWPENQSKNK
jgi:predicted alpha/beta superfamily hydrolase